MTQWLQLTFTVNQDKAEITADYLLALEALSVDLQPASSEDVFNEDLQTPMLWQHTCINALFPETTNLEPIIAELETWLQCSLKVKTSIIEEQDWVRITQSNFPARNFDGLWVYPNWHQENKLDPHITINPGLAFGTGTHPTTGLCLTYLANNPPTNKSVLDYGCGSGILSLAAAKLGATKVTGTDHDEQAITACLDNQTLNQELESFTHFYLSNQMPTCTADLVIANIISSVLRKLHDVLLAHTNLGGTLLLSGILYTEARDMIAVYSQKFSFIKQYNQDEWCALEFVL